MNAWEFLYIEEITVKFKDKIFYLGQCLDKAESAFLRLLNRVALSQVHYVTNMPVFSNIVDANGLCIEYKTQTTERIIGAESIFYMN